MLHAFLSDNNTDGKLFLCSHELNEVMGFSCLNQSAYFNA